MKLLEPVKIRTMLAGRHSCRWCLGKGYLFNIRIDLDATKFREVRPCQCVKQVIRVEDDR